MPHIERILRDSNEGYVACYEDVNSIIFKALREMNYWSIMNKNATTMLKECEASHKYSPRIRRPSTELV